MSVVSFTCVIEHPEQNLIACVAGESSAPDEAGLEEQVKGLMGRITVGTQIKGDLTFQTHIITTLEELRELQQKVEADMTKKSVRLNQLLIKKLDGNVMVQPEMDRIFSIMTTLKILNMSFDQLFRGKNHHNQDVVLIEKDYVEGIFN